MTPPPPAGIATMFAGASSIDSKIIEVKPDNIVPFPKTEPTKRLQPAKKPSQLMDGLFPFAYLTNQGETNYGFLHILGGNLRFQYGYGSESELRKGTKGHPEVLEFFPPYSLQEELQEFGPRNSFKYVPDSALGIDHFKKLYD